MTIRIAIVGFGKIAQDAHLPAIAENGDFDLVAVVAHGSPPDVPCAVFRDVDAMFAAMPGMIDAVAICTPPVPRFPIAVKAIEAGVAVLLEKPPTVTLGELDKLIALADARAVPLFTAWHSQYAAGVAQAEEALAGEEVTRLSLVWREDVRKFHPGQEWIWDAGGFGVFDPGINGLSILTRILSEPLLVQQAELLFPANCQTPIAAQLIFHGNDHCAVMDWRDTGEEQWSIALETASGKTVDLRKGGAELRLNGVLQDLGPNKEYPLIYEAFANSITTGRSCVDRDPLRIVADSFLTGQRKIIEDFT